MVWLRVEVYGTQGRNNRTKNQSTQNEDNNKKVNKKLLKGEINVTLLYVCMYLL